MTEIERILELVAAGKLGRDEAHKLLKALAPDIAKLPDTVIENLFTQLSERQLSSKAVAALLEPHTERDAAQPAWAQAAPAARRKTSRLLRIEIEGSDGSNVRLNLPLGLANFAMKMIPKHAQHQMAEQGIDVALLSEMLKSELPEGNIVEVEGNDGTEIRIWIE